MLSQRCGHWECLWTCSAKTNFGTEIPIDEAPGESERPAKCIEGKFVHVDRIEIRFFNIRSRHLAQVIFDEVERKREFYDTVMKRRQKLIEVMKAKDTEMDESLNGLRDRRPTTLKNDLMEWLVGTTYLHVNINIKTHLLQLILRSSAHMKWITISCDKWH